MMKTRLVQLSVTPGHPRENLASMLAHVEAARNDRVELVVFPEMALPGYLIGDLWEQHAFLRECEQCTEQLRAASQDIIIVFGSVGLDWDRHNEDGRVRKYNALFVAEDGVFRAPRSGPYPFVIKTLHPNYREFDDSRHFYDLRQLAVERGVPVSALITPVETSAGALGCMLCEDAWDGDYSVSPMALLREAGADLFINISASPFTVNKNHKRNRVFAAHARELQRPLLYVNMVGIQNNGKTVYTFDGASCIYDTHGGCRTSTAAFAESALTVDLPRHAPVTFDTPVVLRDDGIADICDALIYGTRQFLELTRTKRVVIGASGGIDSAVVAALCAHILPPQDLLLVNMPSRYNSKTTRGLTRNLAANLGCQFAEIPIEDSVALTHSQVNGLAIGPISAPATATLHLDESAMENVQARDRSARILAALAAAFGGVFTCNANKSEMVVGYTTLYGDLGGFLAIIGDLWKTEVYALARHLNETVYAREVIPQGIMEIPPSAELSAHQDVDAGKGDPLVYPYHDCLFRSWVEWWDRATPEDALTWYAEGVLAEKLQYPGTIEALFPTPAAFIADLERWWNLYQGLGVAKRIQAPPVLAVKKRAFGFDHRESQLQPLYTAAYQEMKEALLGDA